MLRLIGTGLCMLALGGCAEKLMWTKPGASQTDFDRDVYECRKDAYATGGAVYVGYGVTKRSQNMPMYKQCMTVRGYTLEEKAG